MPDPVKRAVYVRSCAEKFGIDESWLDVTGSQRLFGSGEEIASTLRKRIREEIGITISVGVSFNKIFAKLGSDMKKPDAVTCISRENFKEKIKAKQISYLENSDFPNKNNQLRRVIGMPGDIIYMRDYVLYVKPAGEKHFLTEFEIIEKNYEK